MIVQVSFFSSNKKVMEEVITKYIICQKIYRWQPAIFGKVFLFLITINGYGKESIPDDHAGISKKASVYWGEYL